MPKFVVRVDIVIDSDDYDPPITSDVEAQEAVTDSLKSTDIDWSSITITSVEELADE